ncbi:MAG TPA: hypothetical protein DIW47_15955 [Bacteroidetes bacterium]|nr:hypothetical protein [Bacteroidota bacterium]
MFSACNRQEDPNDNPDAADVTAAQEMTIAEQLFGELKNMADEGESGSLGSYKNGAGCATVTHDQGQKKITIDFGSSNCLCKDLRLRRGMLEVTYTGNNYWDSGSVATIIPTNYYVNEYKLSGSKTITNLNHLSDNQPSWSIVVNGTVTKPNAGGSFGWTSDRTHTWLAGKTTPFNWTDDEWQVLGNATLTTSTADEWNLNIILPLHRLMSCRYIDKGTIEIKRLGLSDRYVDYGDGTCDDDAVYIVNGVNYPFKLK